MEWKGYLEQGGSRYKNYLLLWEEGSGKSEIALNLAVHLTKHQPLPVHFFDLDMTKPLFRSRDLAKEMEALGIIFHFEKQFMDAPTQVGGVNRLLRDPGCCVVMDVGGDDIGARAVGGYAKMLGRENTAVYYVVNDYRHWSLEIALICSFPGCALWQIPITVYTPPGRNSRRASSRPGKCWSRTVSWSLRRSAGRFTPVSVKQMSCRCCRWSFVLCIHGCGRRNPALIDKFRSISYSEGGFMVWQR